MKPIRWSVFRGSTHCRECMQSFVEKEYSINELIEDFIPYMPEQEKEAKRLKRLGVKRARQLAKRALERGCW